MFDQNVESTTTFSLEPNMGASYQIAYPIQIRWGGSDESTTQQSSTTSTSNFDSTASSTIAKHDGSSSSLSTGGIVGIALGLFTFGLICAGLGLFLFRRYRKQKLLVGSHTQPTPLYPHPQTSPSHRKGPDFSGGPQEMASPGWDGVNQAHNGWTASPSELDQRNYSAPPLTELDGVGYGRAELGDENDR